HLGEDVRILWMPGHLAKADAANIDDAAKWIKRHFANRAWMAVELHRGADDAAELQCLRNLGEAHGLRLVASGDVRLHKTVAEAGDALFPNGERHLRTKKLLAKIYPADLLEESARIADQIEFD